MSRNRITTLFLVLAIVVLSAIGSWIVGSTIQSPAEAAARTVPPTLFPILVSVEERYSGETFDLLKGAQDEAPLRLVSLKSWRFACLAENQGFSALLKKLDQSAYRLADISNDEADRPF